MRSIKVLGALLLLTASLVVGLGASDTQPPEIEIESPQDGAEYLLNEPVTVSWSVRDPLPGSGVAFTRATQDRGEELDTSTAGDHVLMVEAEDRAGNRAQKRVRYWVRYDVVMEKPLAPSAFEGEAPPSMTLEVGTQIPFSFSVRDYFEQPVADARGTVSVLDADTREIVYLPEDGVGALRYNAESATHDFTLDTEALSPGQYRVIVQFNDGRTLFRVTLTLEPSSTS